MIENQTTMGALASGISRRRFFGYAGALAGAGLLVNATGCNKDDDDSGIDLGSNDTGVLNYAYALEQLEAAFYIRVVATPYEGIRPQEIQYLTDVRDHEIAHREFFRQVLGTKAIPNLSPNFSSVNFASRTSVLTTAMAFEDLGVSAYNGAGKLLTDVNNLGFAGKIVSVEARHAAIIRELLKPHSGADTSILEPTHRIDMARDPMAVLAIAGAYIYEKLNAGNLPTS